MNICVYICTSANKYMYTYVYMSARKSHKHQFEDMDVLIRLDGIHAVSMLFSDPTHRSLCSTCAMAVPLATAPLSVQSPSEAAQHPSVQPLR